MKLVTVELPVQDDLESSLHHLGGGAVELIQEEDPSVGTRVGVPVWRAEAGGAIDQLRKADHVAFTHLREAAVDDVEAKLLSDSVNEVTLADASGALHEDRDCGGEAGGDAVESLDVHECVSP